MTAGQDRSQPRQRVRTALGHRQPKRVPFSWQFCATAEMGRQLETDLAARGLSWGKLWVATEDIVGLGLNLREGGGDGDGAWDIWGIQWKQVDYGKGSYREIARYPLAEYDSVVSLDDYPWPDPKAYDYEALARSAEALPEGKAAKFSGLNPLETLCWMTGLEEVLCRCVSDPDWVVAGMERVTSFYEERTRLALEAAGERIDVAFFADDLGSQAGPLLSPAMYRELIKPYHVRLFSLAKRLAPQAFVMMHSDGSVFAMLEELIDAGLEVLEAVQVECADMEPQRLKDTFGDRLSFHGAISVQQLLPKLDAAGVEAECRRLVEVLGAGGGYVAAPSHAIQIGTPTENVLAMLRGVLGPEDYESALEASRL